MAGEIVRPSALPSNDTPNATDEVVSDDGVTVSSVTWAKGVAAGRPLASQAEAEAGVQATKAMTPLTTNQAIVAQVGVSTASKAQGDRADTAVQPDDLASVATSGDYDDLTNKPTLGTAAAADTTDFATAAQGALADTAVQSPVEDGDLATTLKNKIMGVAADRTALAGMDGTDYVAIDLMEAGRKGLFYWLSPEKAFELGLDLEALVTADTQQGIYVPPTSDTTGASGAWVRQISGLASPAWFGVTGDGTTDDSTALAGIDAVGLDAFAVSSGASIRLATALTLNAIPVFQGGTIKADNAAIVLGGGYACDTPTQCFVESGTGTISIGVTQDVRPEHWGSDASNVRTAMKRSHIGSITRLLGKEYLIDYVSFNNSPDTEDGVDDGKCIVGVMPAARFTGPDGGSTPPSDRQFRGTILRATGAQSFFVLFDSTYTASNRVFSGMALRNVMLHGSGLASVGIGIGTIKDVQLENIYIRDFTIDGIQTNAGSGGNNNQIMLKGFVEIYNCGRDGINGAFGDAQWPGVVRLQHNGRYGFNFTSGYLHAFHIHAYTNGNHGINWLADDASRIDYLRSEDNVGAGLVYAATGDGLTIGTAHVPDNGSDAAATSTQRCGIVNLGKNLVVERLIDPLRTPEIMHNQLYTWYDGASAIGGKVGYFDAEAFGQTSVTGQRGMLVDVSRRNNLGTEFGKRRTFNDTYANIGSALTYPEVYSDYYVTACGTSFTVANTAAANTPANCEVRYQFVANASITVSWGTDFVAQDGSALTGSAMTTGQMLTASFARRGGKWIRQSLVVA